MRTTEIELAEGLNITTDTPVPAAGIDVAAYREGIILLKVTVDEGSWDINIQAGEGADWYPLTDAFGATTTRSITAGADQLLVWQLGYFGKKIRVYFDGTGADQDLTVSKMVFYGKSGY